MRVLLLTDSLGSPREDIDINNLWTYKLMKKYSSNGIVFFTIIRYGFFTSQIPFEQIKHYKPDLIICQMGIVDCLRRALPDSFIIFFNKFPIIGKYIRNYVRKNHYKLTKIYDLRRTKPDIFAINLNKLLQICSHSYFVRIAEGGDELTNKVYNAQQDISTYNQIINSTGHMIDPYAGHESKEYILENDGHHLNIKGHELVFNAINKLLITECSRKVLT